MYQIYFKKPRLIVAIILPLLLIPTVTLGITAVSNTYNKFASISPALFNAIQGETTVRVLVETYTDDYSAVVADIEALHGEVHFQFKYANGLSASIPSENVAMLARNPNVKALSLDKLRTISTIKKMPMIDGTGKRTVFELDIFDVARDDYLNLKEYVPAEGTQYVHLTPEQIELLEPTTYWNPFAMGAPNVWGNGILGQDSLVVIIDTGVFADHLMLGWYPFGPVIGGVDVSYDAGDPTYGGFDNPLNHWHGTHVAGIVAGGAALLVPANDPLYKAMSQYGVPPPPAEQIFGPGYPGLFVIPLFGMAPWAQIYGIKVFDHTGGGVPESMVINAIEYAIWMHEEGGYDVDVINMSLGGGTGYEGYDLESIVVDYATSIGITTVSSTGNEGPTSQTTGSPETANTAIAVAAAAHPVNTRIFYDAAAYGIPGIGHQLFTSNTPQIYAFSSRGPTSDGRNKPEVAATGIYVISAVTPSPYDLAWASGTSMASPAVAGAVALLNTYGEMIGASPYDYKEAIMNGAVWLEGYDVYDQGAGYLNAWDSLLALANDPSWGDPHPPIGPPPSSPALPKGINTGISGSGTFTYEIENLEPGHTVDFYFYASEATDYIEIQISDVVTVRNPYLMNSFELYVQSAVRTGYGYFLDSANVYGDATFYISDYSTTWAGATWLPSGGDAFGLIIQPGHMRVVMENDWTSSGRISGTITITVTETSTPPTPDEEYFGTATTGSDTGYMFLSGWGAEGVIVELWWENDWNEFPTTDLDMLVAWYDGTNWHYDWGGGTLNSPEGVFIDSSNIAAVAVRIFGYNTYIYPSEDWHLRIYYVS